MSDATHELLITDNRELRVKLDLLAKDLEAARQTGQILLGRIKVLSRALVVYVEDDECSQGLGKFCGRCAHCIGKQALESLGEQVS